jgi:hypothetical protein
MTLKFGQDLLKEPYPSGIGAFNARILGYDYSEVFSYPAMPDASSVSCFYLADKMWRDGRIYAVKRFNHLSGEKICKGHAFPYGGTWVCNECEQNNLDKDWWKVKVYKDGNAWICVGYDFEDLQTSDCYAFGDSMDEAIANYETYNLTNRGAGSR